MHAASMIGIESRPSVSIHPPCGALQAGISICRQPLSVRSCATCEPCFVPAQRVTQSRVHPWTRGKRMWYPARRVPRDVLAKNLGHGHLPRLACPQPYLAVKSADFVLCANVWKGNAMRRFLLIAVLGIWLLAACASPAAPQPVEATGASTVVVYKTPT